MTYISSVWSSYGHRFTSGVEYDEEGQGSESCLTCGAVYQLILNDDPNALSAGKYVAADSSEPRECSGDTGMQHGYPGERHCHKHDDGECGHVVHGCNCLMCA